MMKMPLSRSRSVTLVIALATLTSNALSSILFHQLPDDPYHLASNFGWYLHFANVVSVFGFIGALREHALSVAIFSNYLILDTILCSIPRFLVLSMLNNLSSALCASDADTLPVLLSDTYTLTSQQSNFISPDSSSMPDLPYPTSQWDSFSSNWSKEGCVRIVYLAQWTLVAGVIAGTLLQFLGALYVREYARGIWMREVVDDGMVVRAVERRRLREEQGLPVIREEDGDLLEVEKM